MKTAVIMKRELFGCDVEQNSKDEMFNATSLVLAGNKWRAMNGIGLFNFQNWMQNDSTKEFIASVSDKYNTQATRATRGRNGATWVHPLVFIDLALAINPALKIEVYEWLFDNLIKFRNDSGVSYKKMCGALFENSTSKQVFPRYIISVAQEIKEACGVDDWQTATEQQLSKRDKIHDAIALLCDVLRDNDQAVRLAIAKTK